MIVEQLMVVFSLHLHDKGTTTVDYYGIGKFTIEL